MVTCTLDLERALAVGAWTGPTNSEKDYDRVVESLVEVDRAATRSGQMVILIVEVEPGNPAPNSVQRRRISNALRRGTAKTHHSTLVTTSTVVRGIITAVAWLDPDPRRKQTSHASMEEAFAWADALRPGVGARLREMHAEVRARATGRGESS